MLLEARGLGRKFAGVTALQGLNLQVEAGEALALLGPNGAGKSTLLRLCATSLVPTSGLLRLFGAEVKSNAREVRRHIGFLSHQSFLYPDLTPTENLLFYAEMFSVSAARQRVGELIERVGVSGWANRPVRTLSKGLEQRCALARALLHSPRLLLLDEPFNGLDADAAEMLSATLREEERRGTTVMMATHDIDRGARLCGRALVLKRGALRADLKIVAGDEAGLRAGYDQAIGSPDHVDQPGGS